MKGASLQVLESTLLLILAVHTLKTFQVSNQLVIFTVAVAVLAFFAFKKLRLVFLLVFIPVFLFFLLILKLDARRDSNMPQDIHDGVIMTEAAVGAVFAGINPYSVNMSPILTEEKYGNEVLLRPTFHFPYSPVVILASAPFFVLMEQSVGFFDMRVVFVLFFLAACFLASKLVESKQLFLILFALNPLFVPLLFYGANEVIVLFLFFALLYFLKSSRVEVATVFLALIVGTKLLFLPLVPVYLLYLFVVFKKSRQVLAANISIFLVVCALVYLPFLLWNSQVTFNALFAPWFSGGAELYPIAGFVGVAQILSGLGFVSQSSTFPFLHLALPVELIFLYFAHKLLKKSPKIDTFILLSVFSLLIVLAFSRLVQAYYIAFISEILLFAGFVKK